MHKALAALLGVLIGIQPALVRAEEGQAQTPAPAVAQTPVPKTPGLDYDLLSASLVRLRRELAEQPPSRAYTPLKLDFYVEVTADAPPIVLFTPKDLEPVGPVPWGAMTHREFLDLVTPKEFRTPTIPIGSIVYYGIKQLIDWEREKAKRQKEAERRKLLYSASAPPAK
jgi:hypothetical protein